MFKSRFLWAVAASVAMYLLLALRDRYFLYYGFEFGPELRVAISGLVGVGVFLVGKPPQN